MEKLWSKYIFANLVSTSLATSENYRLIGKNAKYDLEIATSRDLGKFLVIAGIKIRNNQLRTRTIVGKERKWDYSRDERIWTSAPSVPNAVLYQVETRPNFYKFIQT